VLTRKSRNLACHAHYDLRRVVIERISVPDPAWKTRPPFFSASRTSPTVGADLSDNVGRPRKRVAGTKCRFPGMISTSTSQCPKSRSSSASRWDRPLISDTGFPARSSSAFIEISADKRLRYSTVRCALKSSSPSSATHCATSLSFSANSMLYSMLTINQLSHSSPRTTVPTAHGRDPVPSRRRRDRRGRG